MVRKIFYDFFKSKNHSHVKSSPLIPINDSSLLFINAGMNQFKNIFLDKEKPSSKRVYNSQKCIRVSGKHNDLEEVGMDSFHHTFFEMLGNWSFGDYYKKEAIIWSWELFTEIYGLDKNRLWVTVFQDDDESFSIWKNYTDINPHKILRSGKKDNFWEMGDTGPCGPCSEIHYYIGDDIKKQSKDGVNKSDMYWELWNLVFIQFNRLKNGNLENLSKKYVDTGAGLERLCAVLQDKKSNYDTDLFRIIINTQEEIFKTKYKDNIISHRAISDHIRMLVFSISDGVIPSNEGRGYVSRRILRRAVRFGYNMGAKEPFLSKLVDPVIKIMKKEYPELIEKEKYVKRILNIEEESFLKTLDLGIKKFNNIISKNSIISGENAFNLYDTFGFPIDLTLQMSNEKNIEVKIDDFNTLMDKQKKRSRKNEKFIDEEMDKIKWFQNNKGESSFSGYKNDNTKAKVLEYYIDNDKIFFELSNTPFYAEKGGQVGDVGYLIHNNKSIKILDTFYIGNRHIHVSNYNENILKNYEFECKVDAIRRNKIKNNHTATHLLHQALIDVLGDHVHQAGSLVNPDYLRFDFTHFNKIELDNILKVEKIVNDKIFQNILIKTEVQKYKDAKKNGAKAMFDEKYGDEVRVVSIGDYSVELCGGTHVNSTGEIGFFSIKQETSLSSGVRRIVAETNTEAINTFQYGKILINNLKVMLNTSDNDILNEVKKLIKDKKILNKKLKLNNVKSINIDKFIKNKISLNSKFLICENIELENIDELKNISNQIISKTKKTISIIYSKIKKPVLVVAISDDLINENLNASLIAKYLGSQMGGGGGGRKNIATAGAKNINLFDDIILNINKYLTDFDKL